MFGTWGWMAEADRPFNRLLDLIDRRSWSSRVHARLQQNARVFAEVLCPTVLGTGAGVNGGAILGQPTWHEPGRAEHWQHVLQTTLSGLTHRPGYATQMKLPICVHSAHCIIFKASYAYAASANMKIADLTTEVSSFVTHH